MTPQEQPAGGVPRADLPKLKWKPIRKEMLRGQYLVTNNIKARDTFGVPSHVWLTTYVQKSVNGDAYGKFMCFDTAERPISNLTHYCQVFGPEEPNV